MQTTLFGAPAATNGFRDSSFAKNKNLPLHRWVPWVAGFSADFVEDALRNYLPKGDSDAWVLDPFAGVGTTLVESYLGGLNVVGFEINPYAALATRIKLKAIRISVDDLTPAQLRLPESCLHSAHQVGPKYQDMSFWS